MKGMTPRQVPEHRARMVEWTAMDGAMGAAQMLSFLFSEGDSGPNQQDVMVGSALARRTGASLKVAELYHITKGKMPEVLEAARALPENMEVQRHWFHQDHGLMMFESGYTTRAYYNEDDQPRFMSKTNESDSVIGDNQTQIYGISWSIVGESIRVLAWTDARQFLRLAASDGFQSYAREMGYTDQRAMLRQAADRIAQASPLVISGQYGVKLSRYLDAAKVEHRTALRILLASCLMLKQYTTAASRVTAPKSTHTYINRVNPHLGKQVTVIDKRDVKPNAGNAELGPAFPTRQLSVRHERKGHWREYKHEKFSEELREHPIWIPAHWVGHDGLPLATTVKVTRLKR